MLTMTSIAVVTPSFNDYRCVLELVKELDRLSNTVGNIRFRVIVVNDSPWVEISDELLARSQQEGRETDLRVLELNANLGHQAALAIGLAWLLPELDNYQYIVTIDADGEDNPSDIIRMIQTLSNDSPSSLACVARRRVRMERLLFRMGYKAYKSFSNLLIGTSIDYGNFICFRPAALKILARKPETTVHIAASVLHSRMPFRKISSDRRKRYSGESRMGGYSSLVLHGFRAYTVFGDKIAVRLMMFVLLGLGMVLIGVFAAGLIRFTGLIEVFPGWASIVSLVLIGFGSMIAINLFGLALLLIIISSSSLRASPLDYLEQFLAKDSWEKLRKPCSSTSDL